MNVYRQLKIIQLNDDILDNMSKLDRLFFDSLICAISTYNDNKTTIKKYTILNDDYYCVSSIDGKTIDNICFAIYKSKLEYTIVLPMKIYNMVIRKNSKDLRINVNETVDIFLTFLKNNISPKIKSLKIIYDDDFKITV